LPTYEYRCPNGHEFEHFFRTISAALAELPCPTCSATAARKVSGGSALLFKGSGFYITDYGKDGKKDLRKPSKTDKSDSASGGSSTSDSAKGSSPSEPGKPDSSPSKSSSKDE
jgi:putative FmdB family regulatory protein